jgi:translation initiation factor IF-2
MSNPQDPQGRKPLSLGNRASVKSPSDLQQVRQSFSHGRSKTVVVEVRKKRGAPGSAVSAPASAAPAPAETMLDFPAAPPPAQGQLTDSEWEARKKALEAMQETRASSRTSDAWQEEWQRLRDAANTKPEPEPEILAAPPPPPAPTPDLPAPEAPSSAAPGAASVVRHGPKGFMEDEAEAGQAARRRGGFQRPEPRKTQGPARRDSGPARTGRLNVHQVLDDSMEMVEKTRSLAALRRAREKEKMKLRGTTAESVRVVRDVIVPETITVQELANRMAERATDVIRSLMKMGMLVTVNQILDADTAELVVSEFGHKIRRVSASDIEQGLDAGLDQEEDLRPRPPVVTIMGHVDHGKTSLLDAIRQTDVVSSEAGGITQHIGAYQILTARGNRISFIDTPGHAAFGAMRARGAQVTDIVILVVAADDGVKEQTVEALRHAQAAGVPLIVAVNKMDKPDAQPERVLSDLAQYDVVSERYGGDVLSVEVSARTGMNLDKLEDAILLQAEVLNLKANPFRPASGTVIESCVDRGRGAVATVIVQKGTLRLGDLFVAGCQWGRVRSLHDHYGHSLTEAGPGLPVEVGGFDAPALAGDLFVVADSETKARQVAEFRTQRLREQKLAAELKKRTDNMGFTKPADRATEMTVLVKADVQGSAEALTASLQKLSGDEVVVRVLHTAVGPVNESDVLLAAASRAMILGFNVRAHPKARDLAKQHDILIQYCSVIYDAIEDIKARMSGLLSPLIQEKILGYATVRQVFTITRVGKVAGCMVTEGLVKRGGKVRLLRDSVVIHEGALKTLKRIKDEVKEVRAGYECGMAFENWHDLREGDQIECFELEALARTL